MKKLNYLFVCLVTLYVAGMYRYLPLMALAVLGLVFLAVSCGMSHYFRRNLSVRAMRHSDSVQVMTPLCCSVEVRNRGKLPINLFRIRVLSDYGPGTGQEKKYIYSDSECGEDMLIFELKGDFCGMMHLYMDRLQVYDYMSLFSASKKLREEVKIAVFPQERALHIELPSLCCQAYEYPREVVPADGAEAHSEVRQLREYHAEDSKRHIHWNQSARMERLMVKEYEKESDMRVSLHLELDGMGTAEVGRKSRFYELLSALVLGLLQKAAVVNVFWYDGQQKCPVGKEVSDGEQCRDVLSALYKMEENPGNRIPDLEIYEPGKDLCGYFKLDLELKWYWDDVLIYQFSSGKTLYDEIMYKTFVV